MGELRVVTDSGSDLSPEIAAEHNIEVVPLTIRFGSEEFTDQKDLTPQQFYDKMAQSDTLPETAAPAPGAFAAAFQKLSDEGATDIICIDMSSDLSATGQSARTAGAGFDGATLHFVDSRSVSVGLGNLALAAAAAANSGTPVDEVLDMLASRIERTHVFAVLDTLDNLKKGGRIGNAQAMLGSMLSIKPCIDISNGVVEEAGRQRTRKKALAWLREQAVDAGPITGLTVGHGLAADVDDFVGDLSSATGIPRNDIGVAVIGPVIGAHGGPGVTGISFVDA